MTLSKNVLTVMTGTVIGQLIPVLATPLLSRLYSAEQFGILALYMSISALFVLIASGRYEMAIMLPPEKEKANNLVGLSLSFTVLTTLLSVVIVGIFRELFAHWFKAESLGRYLMLIPVSVFAMGIYQTFYNWALREKLFKVISSSRIVQSIGTVVASLIIGWTQTFVQGLIIGFIAGQFLGAIYIFIIIHVRQPIEWGVIRYQRIREVAHEFRDFPRINIFHALLDTLQNYGLNILISISFGNQVLGWFSFSYRILRAPLAIVGSAYSQVLYSEVNTMKINGTPFKPLLIKSIRKIMLICFPFFLVLLFFAPFIFKIAFGDEWEQAGVLTRLLIPWLVMNFLASPISQVPNIMGQQRKAFLINLIGVLAAFAGLILSIQVATSFEYPFLVFSTISALYLIYFVRWILKLSEINSEFRI